MLVRDMETYLQRIIGIFGWDWEESLSKEDIISLY
jgi:hypothetical protein